MQNTSSGAVCFKSTSRILWSATDSSGYSRERWSVERVLVIIPAYNEEDSIVSVVMSVIEAGYDYIVINDGSTDKTAEICREHAFAFLDLSANLGIGGAVQTGHKYALLHNYDIDIQFDGDGQHPVGQIKDLVEQIKAGVDLAVGSRFISSTDGFKSTFMRRVGIRWLTILINVFTGKHISDSTSGFRACSRPMIKLFSLDYPTDYPEPESLVAAIKKGYIVKETPVSMHERQGGQSSIRVFSSMYYMIKVTLAILVLAFSSKRIKE